TIDILRFIASSMVVFFHLSCPIVYLDNFYRSLVKYGYIGVPIFFVISGYCILLSAHSCKNLKDFVFRRFFRIFPVYWLSLAIVFGVMVFQKLATGTNSVAVIPSNSTDIFNTIFILTKP